MGFNNVDTVWGAGDNKSNVGRGNEMSFESNPEYGGLFF